MKAKIEHSGQLCIERRGTMVQQLCPIFQGNPRQAGFTTQQRCNDRCPLFVEEEHLNRPNTIILGCSQQRIEYEVVKDERDENSV